MSSVHIRTWLALRWLLPAVWRKISDFMHNISFCEFQSGFIVNFLVLIWSLLIIFSKRKENYNEISLLINSSKTGQEIHKNWQCALLAHIQRKFVNLKLLSFVESIKCIFWSIFHCESAQKSEWVHPQHSGWFWQEFLNPWQDDTSNKNKNWNFVTKNCRKLFWPTVRKNCSSDLKNFANSQAFSLEFQKLFSITNFFSHQAKTIVEKKYY